MIEIKHKDTGEVLLRVDADTLQGANLRGANLEGADLRNANLGRAHLLDADLSFADLTGAHLIQANMQRARLLGASLIGAEVGDAELQDADLLGADLTGARVQGAGLHCAFMQRARLTDAKLTRANLSKAFMAEADLQRADLIDVNLGGAELVHANLADARLIDAWLVRANLTGANLRRADLAGAQMGRTLLLACEALHEACSLEEVRHRLPSFLDLDTLRASAAYLPDAFLNGAGYTNDEITALRALYSSPEPFHSCLISYLEPDSGFADRLRAALLANRVSCWPFPDDLRRGRGALVEIEEMGKLLDRLILVCSEPSLRRLLQSYEIRAAMRRELESHVQHLFPVLLDRFLISDQMLALADETKAANPHWEDWVRHLRAHRHYDFRGWKNVGGDDEEFCRLLEDLRNPTAR